MTTFRIMTNYVHTNSSFSHQFPFQEETLSKRWNAIIVINN
jgi:hypothetical protein